MDRALRQRRSVHRQDLARAVAVDPDTGNIFVVGYTTTPGINAEDGVLIAYSPDGALLSAQPFGQAGKQDRGFDVAVLPNGTAVATASATLALSDAGVTTIAVRPDGTRLWTASSRGLRSGYELTVDPRSSNVFVAGVEDGEARVLSYTSDGAFRWLSQLGADNPFLTGKPQIAVTPQGEAVLAATYQFGGATKGYMLTQRFSDTGQILVARTTSTSPYAPIADLQIDPDTGYAYALVSVLNDPPEAATEIRLLVYDAGLRLRSQVSYDSEARYEYPTALAIDSRRNRVIIVGQALDFGVDDTVLTVAYRTLG